MAINTTYHPDARCAICGEAWIDENGLRHATKATVGHDFEPCCTPTEIIYDPLPMNRRLGMESRTELRHAKGCKAKLHLDFYGRPMCGVAEGQISSSTTNCESCKSALKSIERDGP